MSKRFTRLLTAIMPGLFLLGYNIGTGSVTAMAKAGAHFGMGLLWTVLLSCIITWRLIALYGRLTVVSGETALQAFRRHLHPAVPWFFIIALTANVCGSVMGVMGIISIISQDVVTTMGGPSIPPLAWAVGYTGLVYSLFLTGRNRVFEKVLALLVGLMGAVFVANVFIMPPQLGETLRGLVPSIPDAAGGAWHLVIASMVGTTVFSGLFIVRTMQVREEGWTMADAFRQERDALVSAFLMFLMGASIMAAAAGTLHASGVALDDATQMVGLLEPLAGPTAAVLFGVGIVAAGLSSQFPNVILLPWLLCDRAGERLQLRRPLYRVLVLAVAVLGLTVPLTHGRPLVVMLVSQAFGALLLPVTVGCLAILGNRRSMMGEHRFRLGDNLFLAFAMLFALAMSAIGFRAFFTLLQN